MVQTIMSGGKTGQELQSLGGRKSGKTPTKQRANQQSTSSQPSNVSQGGTAFKQGYPSQALLDDLCSRFVLNSPVEELRSFERLLFLIESAHWFYEDHTRDNDPTLKSFNLREFTALMFQKCAALQPYVGQVDDIYKDFTAYKFQVPTTGAIILNQSGDKVLLVKGWKAGSSWGFPKGKKNKDEDDASCAIREVLEETNLDISGMVEAEEYLELVMGQQRSRLFIVVGVPEDTPCEPRTKKEISEIAWHSLEDMGAGGNAADGSVSSHSRGISGAKYFNVSPFIRPLNDWLTARGLRSLRPALPGRLHGEDGGITTVWKAKSVPGLASPIARALPPVLPGDPMAATLALMAGHSMAALQLAPLPPGQFPLPPGSSLAMPPAASAAAGQAPYALPPVNSTAVPAVTLATGQTPYVVPPVSSGGAPPATLGAGQASHAAPPVSSLLVPPVTLAAEHALPLLTPMPGRHPIGPNGSLGTAASPGRSLRAFRFDTERILRSLEFVPP